MTIFQFLSYENYCKINHKQLYTAREEITKTGICKPYTAKCFKHDNHGWHFYIFVAKQWGIEKCVPSLKKNAAWHPSVFNPNYTAK